jgi:hypothetical protein
VVSDRGLSSDASLACPFVALEDDRDARSTRPDHRHRCFAELRPAPRAVAHQEAYCLSAGFATCPTFVDWARREAARARPASETTATEPHAAMPPPIAAGRPAPGEEPEAGSWPRREPQRDWAAPPPWTPSAAAAGVAGVAGSQMERAEPPRTEPSGSKAPPATPGPEVEAPSFLASHGSEPPRSTPPPPPPPRTAHDALDFDDELEAGQVDESGWAEPETEEPQMRRFGPAAGRTRYDDTSAGARPAGSKSAAPRRRPPADPDAPSWEKPRRQEAYPTLRTRAGLSGLSPLLGVGLVIVLAAAALFFIPPMLLGLGGDSGASPTPSASGATASATPDGSPTPAPSPTPLVYVVKTGDTLTKIAKSYGVTLDALIAANKATLPNPDKLQIGDQLIIPLGDAEPTLEAPSPSP